MSAPFTAEVADYLADCARYAALLRPDCHPTEDGAVKLIWHRGAGQAEEIRAAFRAAVADQAARQRGCRARCVQAVDAQLVLGRRRVSARFLVSRAYARGPVNQAAGAVSVLASGWLASGALRGFRAGDGIGPVSLLLLIGAALITAAAFRAAALPRPPAAPAAPR